MRLSLFLFCGFLAYAGIPSSAVAEAQLYSVARVINAKNVQLEGGQIVRLASLQAPNLADVTEEGESRQGEPLAADAKTALEKLLSGKKLYMLSVGKTNEQGRSLDRKGRWVAHAYSVTPHEDKKEPDTVWIQEAMLSQGWGMTYVFEDSCETGEKKKALSPCFEIKQMLKTEDEARKAGRGIWADPYYRIVDTESVQDRVGRFTLVEGVVKEVMMKKGIAYLNFGADWKADFTLTVDREHLKDFDANALLALQGKKVRARGWVQEKNGPMIELVHPLQMETLP